MAQTQPQSTSDFDAQSAQATNTSMRRAIWIAVAAGGLTAMGFVSTYGLTWAITAVISGMTMGVGLVCFAALKVYERLKDFHLKARKAAVNMNKAAIKAQARLEHVLELKEAILQTNDRIYEILGQVKDVFGHFGVKVKTLDVNAIQEAVLSTLEKAQTAMHSVEGSVTGLSETANTALKEALTGVNLALSEVAKEYVSFAQKAQDGVESVDGQIQDFKARLEVTLDKLDIALINLNKTAQGGSDLLAPIRGIGNIFRSLKGLLTGGSKPSEEAESDEVLTSSSSSSVEEYSDEVGAFVVSPFMTQFKMSTSPLPSPELTRRIDSARQEITGTLRSSI